MGATMFGKQQLAFALVLGFAVLMATAGSGIGPYLRSLLGAPPSNERAAAIAVGAVYCLMGLGTAYNAVRRKFPTFVDNEKQERRNAFVSAIAIVSAGTFLVIFAHSGLCGLISNEIIVFLVAIVSAIYIWADRYLNRYYSIESRKIAISASSWFGRIAPLALFSWAGLAQAGLPVSFSPLTLATAVAVLSLFSVGMGARLKT